MKADYFIVKYFHHLVKFLYACYKFLIGNNFYNKWQFIIAMQWTFKITCNFLMKFFSVFYVSNNGCFIFMYIIYIQFKNTFNLHLIQSKFNLIYIQFKLSNFNYTDILNNEFLYRLVFFSLQLLTSKSV